MDPDRFLASHPPFDRLGEDAFDRIRATIELSYVPRGQVLLRRGEEPSKYLWVVRKGAVRLEREGRVLQVLEEGEPFGFPSLLSGSQPHADVVAEEDSVLLRLPGPVFHKLMEVPRFADFFLTGLADRLRRTTASAQPSLSGDMAVAVESLVTRPPVLAEASLPVVAAARRMCDERVSSLLVVNNGGGGESLPDGIVTDRDLRSRVLAEGRSADTPVGEVASRPLRTVPAEAPTLTALIDMIESRVHHLAVVRGGQVVGVVTDTDLLRHHHKSPLAMLQRIDRAASVEGLMGYSAELAAMVEMLFRGGLDAVEIGRIVSTVHDAAGTRLLRLAERELGPPPRPYAWIVFGSEGRREQALLTDQDNALVYADPADGEDDRTAETYFAALAEKVVHGLVSLGIPLCEGGFMATNWHHPLSWWRRTFSSWLAAPEPEALMEAANFFDYRRIGGGLSLEPLAEVIQQAPQQRSFLAHLAKNALDFKPPLGLFHRIRRQDGGVDLKKGGIMPIVSMARLWALEAGLRNRGTLNRLSFAADAGGLSRQGAEDQAEAFRFLLRLRLEHQLAARHEDRPVDNVVAIEELAPLERRHLKDTFLSVREMQTFIGQRYNINLLG